MPRVSPARVLVIDADPDYRAVIARCVEMADAAAQEVSAPATAFHVLEEGGIDLVVWGISPQEAQRTEIVAQLRQRARIPMILLDESYEEVRASFEAGADQVLPKPFVPGALVGAVKAALRDSGAASVVPMATRIEVGGAVLDSDSRTITKGDRMVSFSSRDWELLTYFLANPGQWFSADELVRQAWRSSRYSPDQLRSYVMRLRRKMEPLDLPFAIISRQGSGYRFVLEP
jgi:DNA-binding response OmpR family regulator